MTHPRVVGLYSPAPQSGKTAVAYELQQHGYILCSFASPLKRMLGVFLNSAGYGHEHIEKMLFEKKEERISEFGVSPRHLMQTLGTEWGRDCISPNVWVDIWKESVQKWLDGGLKVVVDDMRFPNEWDAVKSFGGECWYVTRPRAEHYDKDHISEGALDHHGFDRRLINEGDLPSLYVQIANEMDRQPSPALL